MDTPEKVPTGTPISNFEESPFSNFINSLSPIRPSKPMNMSQTLGSLNFTSPPSVFTSPHISLRRESKFIRGHQLVELAKLDQSSKNENTDPMTEDDINGDCPINFTSEVTGAVSSEGEVSADASREVSDCIVELPMELKYDCSSPTAQTEPGNSSCIPLLKEACGNDAVGEQLDSFVTDENEACHRDNLISDAADFLVFESPQDPASMKEPTEQSVDEQINLFASFLSHISEDDANDQEDEQQDVRNDQISQSAEANEQKQIYQTQDSNRSSSSVRFTGQTIKRLENKPLMHHGVRRRCLVFEIQGARKNADGGPVCTSSSSLEGGNTLTNNKHSTLGSVGDSPICIRPGFGVHLNALAVASMEHSVLKPENHSSQNQPQASESFITSALISSEEHESVENELSNAGDASQASASGADDDTNPSSPENKRPRNESNEGEACKRCNCKKSKCLKLYCECFAAGVYCADPCACHDCFNKPIHEETVMATRKQIESRNPLAFAPKVVKGTKSSNDLGDDSNRTPASARHKRGCNCKRSSCLKKYCECFQSGVGCSIGCRCEGCKNKFGRRDGSTIVGMELDVEEDTDSNLEDKTLLQPRKHIDEELNLGSTLPMTPSRLFRSSLSLPSSSKDKHARFLGMTSCSLLSRDGPGRSTFLRKHKTDNNLQNEASGEEFPAGLQNTCPSSIKTLSPNSKRISPPQSGNSDGIVRSTRKLILQSIPSFPSLTPRR